MHMDFKPQIELLKGFAGFKFGQTITEAEQQFGAPEETQVLDDEILETSCTVLHYWDIGFSLFFDNKNLKKCSSVEIDNEETILFGQLVFTLNEKGLTDLMKQHGYVLSDTEQQDWGEKRLSFDEAGLDCYFENGQLKSVNFGVIDDIGTFAFLPN